MKGPLRHPRDGDTDEDAIAFDDTVVSVPSKAPASPAGSESRPSYEQDVDDHIIMASLQPAARLIHELRVGLRDLKRLSELASFRELRRAGLKLREISEWLGISTAKVGLLSRQLKDRFAASEAAQSVPRRILSVLWAMPLTEAGIYAALKDVPNEELEETLESLVEEGLLERTEEATPRFRLVDSRYRLVKAPWTARIDGVNNLMSSIGNVLIGRLFRADERAFVRTLQFHVREKDFERLRQFYEVALFPLIDSLESSAQEHPEDSVPVQLSVLWTPEYDGVEPGNEGDGIE